MTQTHRLEGRSGQLLMEVLLAIAAAAILSTIAAQMIIVSLRSNQSAGERDIATGLAQETLEGVRSTGEENWLNLYNLTKGTSTNYYAQQASGKWSIATGTETVTLNGIGFTRYFTIQNVSRSTSTRGIDSVYNSTNDDPSTQQLQVTVNWRNGGLVVSDAAYISRWRNKACSQTSWTTGGSSGGKTCPDTTYSSSSNITTGTTLQLCSGGC